MLPVSYETMFFKNRGSIFSENKRASVISKQNSVPRYCTNVFVQVAWHIMQYQVLFLYLFTSIYYTLSTIMFHLPFEMQKCWCPVCRLRITAHVTILYLQFLLEIITNKCTYCLVFDLFYFGKQCISKHVFVIR